MRFAARRSFARRSLVRAVPVLLRERKEFRRFWLGQTLSLFGDQVSALALPLVGVLVLDASPAQMGYLVAAGFAPNLIFPLFAGAWVDRVGHRRRIMIAADLGRACLLVAIPVSAAAEMLSLGELYVVAFLTGTLSVFFSVSYSGLFVSLVSPDKYIEANSLLSGSRALSFVGGPSLGGFLVQLATAPLAILADACSFLASAWLLCRISPHEPQPAEIQGSHVLAGMRFIRRTPVIWSALGATSTINLFNFMFFALFLLYATRSLHLQPGVLGLVLGAGAVGGLVGAGITQRLTRRIGVGWTVAVGALLFPAPLLLVPLASGPTSVVLALLFAAEFGSGLGVMILDISLASLFAAVIPDDLRARVSGAYLWANYGVRPIGSLIGGALGTAIGMRSTLLLAAVGGMAGFLWLLPSPLLRLRALPGCDGLTPTDPLARAEI